MFDRETWRFINTFAPWLSAVGTLTAVIVSLYLARRAARLNIRVSLAIVKMIPPIHDDSQEFFQIRVVNHGTDAVIQGIMWQQRWLAPQLWIVLPPDDHYSTRLPVKIAFGESAQFFFPTATFNRLAKSLLERLKASRFPALSVRLLRAGVFAGTGQEFVVPLDMRLRKFLLERATQV